MLAAASNIVIIQPWERMLQHQPILEKVVAVHDRGNLVSLGHSAVVVAFVRWSLIRNSANRNAVRHMKSGSISGMVVEEGVHPTRVLLYHSNLFPCFDVMQFSFTLAHFH